MSAILPKILDNALGYNVSRIALLFRRELMKALSEYKITPEQWQILATLWEAKGPLRQNDLAFVTLRDKHTVSRIVSRLERDGWLLRKPDPEDARAWLVSASRKAEKAKDKMPAKLRAHFAPLLKILSPAEQDQLLQTFRRLRTHFGDTDNLTIGDNDEI